MTANSARMRGLATELQDLRKAAGLTLRDVSERTGFSLAKLSRIENWIREISVEDTASLLGVYAVTGADRARLLDQARNIGQPSWWAIPREHLSPHLPTLIDFEADATRIIHSAMLRIPGLLQIPDYSRTVMMVSGVPADRARSLVEARLYRQEVLHKPNPPHYLAILDEAAIFRPTGSSALMAAQLAHVCAMAELPNVDIRVIPREHGHHVGLGGSYVLMYFPKAPPVIHMEHPKSTVFLNGPEEVRMFQEATDSLMGVALASADSVKFLRRYEAQYSRE
ncbi:helix-turn-helix domain-containing protein [Actinokineospora sp. HUAS TT18]|uniref:helix-turn-helix domain-containing protein n=1 Tax=Actinokineospora sp. HUAS TT18 TaxID=3447451 RepID=UPI003F524B96